MKAKESIEIKRVVKKVEDLYLKKKRLTNG